MSPTLRTSSIAAALLAACALTASAQSSLTRDLVTDVSQVEQKMMGLAKAMSPQQFEWRPGAGVRSVGEVFLHVASDNYLIPAVIGIPVDPATGIKGDDYRTAQAFEQRKLGKDAVIAELEKSFAFLKKSIGDTPADKLASSVKMFGQDFTMQQAWILATTHLHEHLGQSIAYARSNGVKPPWSQ